MKLIKMTDFVEEIRDEMTLKGELNFKETKKYFDKVFNYSDFLKQPVKLEMLVPCDENGNIIDKVDFFDERFELKKMIYDEAKEKVLLEGFTFKDNVVLLNNNIFYSSGIGCNYFFMHYQTIEDLSNHFLANEIILTQAAIKLIHG